MEKFKVVVICSNCGQLAPYDLPDASHPWGVWHTDGPCRHCGAMAWAGHDTNRDWRTGRLLEEPTSFGSKE